ncbi:hypothetical protein [Vibrio jasicida]|uniref:hypothetical protein n=1 Tax=Vibrio jasicida TaxID=766224 RepID=UPI0015E4602C|nr:hypothetical protein [Vibrio jasicida]
MDKKDKYTDLKTLIVELNEVAKELHLPLDTVIEAQRLLLEQQKSYDLRHISGSLEYLSTKSSSPY